MKIDPSIKQELKRVYQEKLLSKKEAVTVYSSFELNNEERETLLNKIPELNRRADISYKIDKNIVAGIIIKVGSKIIDLSIKGQLNSLRNKLYEYS